MKHVNLKTFSRSLLGLTLLLSLAAAAIGQEGTLIHDHWSLMKMAGDEVGWLHETLTELEADGQKQYRTCSSTFMEMKRFGQSVVISGETWTLEDSEGKIIKMGQKSLMSGQETLYDLVVKGEEAVLTITTMGKPRETTIPWEADVRGGYGAILAQKKFGTKPGTEFSIKSFAFDMGKIMTINTVYREKEETELLEGEMAFLNHGVTTLDIMPGIKTDIWVTDDYKVVKTSVNLMGMTMENFMTTKERAMQSEGSELNADMLIESMARSNVTLPSPYRLDSILYKFEAKDKDLGLPEDMNDLRQKVLESDGQTATILIETKIPESSQKRPMVNPPPELMEYLEANSFLQCDHQPLIEKAHEVVGEETNAWLAACKLENFVFEYIADKNFGTGFASAAEVFENPTGDCSEHGVLLAACCRAVGIPARVAMGYMYLGGIFGGHMWAEVWIEGEWYAIDGVMGIGRVDPTHITFCTSSLNDGGIGESFVTAMQGLGNINLTILEFTQGDRTINVSEGFKDYKIDSNTYTNTLYGISISKPDGYEFEDYERDMSGVSFTLVQMEGESDAELKALPAAFSFTMDDFKSQMTRDSVKILSEIPRKVQGRPASVFMIEQKKKVYRILALITKDTCFVLSMRIEKDDEERDLGHFEGMVKSIRLSS